MAIGDWDKPLRGAGSRGGALSNRQTAVGHRRFPSRGFTMLEILVVMVIIGLVAVAVVPSMSGRVTGMRLNESARKLLVTARFAHDFAVTHCVQARLVVDPLANTVRVQGQVDPDNDPTLFGDIDPLGKLQSLDPGVAVSRLDIQAAQELTETDFELGASSGVVVFQPDGTADATIIELTDGTRSFCLTIQPMRGRAELVEGTVEELPSERRDLDAEAI